MKNFVTGRRLFCHRFHSISVPGRVGGGVKLRRDLVLQDPTKEQVVRGDHRSGVVLSKRVPEEFIDNTLLPHLEERMRMSIHVYTPSQLVQVARSYSKYTAGREDRGSGPLVEKLIETVKYRMPGFEAIDIIDILPAACELAPEDDELFGMLSDRMREKMDDFNALNLVGVVRAYLKRGDVQVVKELLLPRLIDSLKSYDAVEVAEMLIAIGQATGTDLSLSGDVHILQCLVPEVERRFETLPLVIQLNCVWALAKLNVNHSLMRDIVVGRFCESKLVSDLPTKIVAKACWIFGRLGAWSCEPRLVEAMTPSIKQSRGLFSSSEFARLVMGLSAVPEAREDLVEMSRRLVEALTSEEEMLREAGSSTKKQRLEVMMLLSGMERLGLVHASNHASIEPIVNFLKKEESKFDASQVQQLVGLFSSGPNEALIDSVFPASWKDLIQSSRTRISQIQAHYS
jgi:hypothetical protein